MIRVAGRLQQRNIGIAWNCNIVMLQRFGYCNTVTLEWLGNCDNVLEIPII